MVASVVVPRRRDDLQLSQLGDGGDVVVKNRGTGEFFRLGNEEAFLLDHLDGQRSFDNVCAAYQERFQQPLSNEDLRDFLELAHTQGLVHPNGTAPAPLPAAQAPAAPAAAAAPHSAPQPPRRGQSILRWRQPLFDPDRLFDCLHPRLRFLWTPTFVALSAGAMLLAGAVVLENRAALAASFAGALRWETVALAWIILLAATTLHEFAHGLTCKHFGGEVHEIGALLIFFMPGLYCNVSDAWLFRKKSQRLWVTVAGGWCDLVVWSIAVFIWRLTEPESLANYLAYVVLSVVGTRVLLNLNPLIKLDGYYFLSDWMEVPNLQQTGMQRVMAWLRWLLWGAARPEPHPRGGFLLLYGAISWCFGLFFLSLMIVALAQLAGDRWGPVASLSVFALSALVVRNLFHGFFDGEFAQMLLQRHRRTAFWVGAGVITIAVVLAGHITDRATGGFQLRPVTRLEVRAPVSGFLHAVLVEEGDTVKPGQVVVRMQVPNLETRIGQNRAELREVTARLNLVAAGARSEELTAYRNRADRARHWRDLAAHDLDRARRGFDEEITQLERQVVQQRVEAEFARGLYERLERLRGSRAVADEAVRDAAKRLQTTQAQLEHAEAQQRARKAIGCRDGETELARRERELAEAESSYELLAAGARPEEVEAERARLARATEEMRYLQELLAKQTVPTTIPGVVATPRLAERVGQYLHEGELICVIEQPGAMEAEVVLADQNWGKVNPGQRVELKPRDCPRQTLHGTVDRVAPRAAKTDAAGPPTVTVYCTLDDPTPDFRAGTIGHARITCSRKPIRDIFIDKVLLLIRAEFWW